MRTWPWAWQLPPRMSIRRNNCFFTFIISEGSARGHDLNVKQGTEIRTGDTHIPVPIPNPIWLPSPLLLPGAAAHPSNAILMLHYDDKHKQLLDVDARL